MQGLLYLTHRIPFPPNKGDKIRSFHLLQHLSKRYRIYLGTFIDDEKDWRYAQEVKSYCQASCLVPLNPVAARLRSLPALLGNQPLTLAYYRNRQLQRWVEEILQKEDVQNAVVFSAAMAQFLSRAAHIRRIIDFVDVDSDKWQQYALSKAWPFNWLYRRESACLLDYERKVASEFDSATFVSEKEADLFKQLAPEAAHKTTFFNNGVDTGFFSPAEDYANPYPVGARPLVFTGAMDYWANIDAVNWFAHAIFPKIRTRMPEAVFYIVGARPAKSVQALADLPGVTVTGGVKDIRPYLQHAWIAVAPLRIARGIQNKVLEAMAMQKPVVASLQAMEGINAVPDEELCVAEDAEQFVEQVHALLEAHARRTTIGLAARNRVLQAYNWSHSLARIDALLEDGHSSNTG